MDPLQENLISFLEIEADTHKGLKLQIPQRCTIPHRGPLQLQSQKYPKLDHHNRHVMCANPLPKLTKRKETLRPLSTLNRFPLELAQRPIEEAKENVYGLSSLDLKENIEKMNVLTRASNQVHLPELLIRQNLTTYDEPNHRHYHHVENGPMNITITLTKPRQQQVDINLPLISAPPTPRPPTQEVPHSVKLRRVRPHHVPLAPPSLSALLVHRQQPLTTMTGIRGMRLG